MINQTVDQLFSIIIIGMPRCPFCEQMKIKYLEYFTSFMQSNFNMKVYYKEINNRNTAEAEIMELTGSPGFPHVGIIQNTFFDNDPEYWTMILDNNLLRTLMDKILDGKTTNENVLKRYIKDNLRLIIKSLLNQ